MNKTLLVLALLITFHPCSRAESRSERKARELEESAAPAALAGGQICTVTKDYDLTYEKALTYLKLQGQIIDAANRDTGQIITAITVKGGWRQTGTRYYIILIKQEDHKTGIRTLVTLQKRFKALQTEPWGEPQEDQAASVALGAALQKAIEGT